MLPYTWRDDGNDIYGLYYTPFNTEQYLASLTYEGIDDDALLMYTLHYDSGTQFIKSYGPYGAQTKAVAIIVADLKKKRDMLNKEIEALSKRSDA